MSPVQVDFRFDNELKAYTSGDTVSGHVLVHVTDEELSFESIELQHVGQAQVQWTEKKRTASGGSKKKKTGHNAQTKTEHYSSREYYFKHKETVLEGNDSSKLSMGTHPFPFSFLLPPQLPSSFEMKFGWIRYYVKVKIIRSWAKFNIKHSELFTVNSILDLNRMANVGSKAEASGIKTKCCLCCKDGPVSVSYSIPKTGYAPAETIKVNCDIDNKGRNTVGMTQLKIKGVVKYKTPRKTKISPIAVGNIKLPGIGPGDNQSLHNVAFTVPALAPSGLAGCNIMDIAYSFNLDMSLGTFSNLSLAIPIVIGNVPLQSGSSEDTPSYLEAVTIGGPRLGLEAKFTPLYWTFTPQASAEGQMMIEEFGEDD